MKNVLVLVFSNLKHDARVMRQVNWIRKRFRLTVVCFDADEMPDVTLVKISQTKLTLTRKAMLAFALVTRQYGLAFGLFHNYEFLMESLGKQKFDLIVANDIDTLPLAFKIGGDTPIIFDAHEYAPRHFENNRTWKLFFQNFYVHLCKRYIPQTAGMLTVGSGLAKEYETNFGVKPEIITNATRYVSIAPVETKTDKIRLIHHGIINPSRKLELMIEMMEYLDHRFTLDLMLMTSDYASGKTKLYIDYFKKRIEKDPRIRIVLPVKSAQVVETINNYDIGVFLIPPINFNYANTLPNKLFDFIQARLGVAIGPTPEMAAIVNAFKNGVVSVDFTARSLAEKLQALKHADIQTFKINSGKAAEVLNAEKNEVIFNQLIDQILKN
jgi:hypothetical protein